MKERWNLSLNERWKKSKKISKIVSIFMLGLAQVSSGAAIEKSNCELRSVSSENQAGNSGLFGQPYYERYLAHEVGFTDECAVDLAQNLESRYSFDIVAPSQWDRNDGEKPCEDIYQTQPISTQELQTIDEILKKLPDEFWEMNDEIPIERLVLIKAISYDLFSSIYLGFFNTNKKTMIIKIPSDLPADRGVSLRDKIASVIYHEAAHALDFREGWKNRWPKKLAGNDRWVKIPVKLGEDELVPRCESELSWYVRYTFQKKGGKSALGEEIADAYRDYCLGFCDSQIPIEWRQFFESENMSCKK